MKLSDPLPHAEVSPEIVTVPPVPEAVLTTVPPMATTLDEVAGEFVAIAPPYKTMLPKIAEAVALLPEPPTKSIVTLPVIAVFVELINVQFDPSLDVYA